jgi:hypothetical protein
VKRPHAELAGPLRAGRYIVLLSGLFPRYTGLSELSNFESPDRKLRTVIESAEIVIVDGTRFILK